MDNPASGTSSRWSIDRCILCTNKPNDSYEHIIPESIGGSLEVKLLCSQCNKYAGSRIVSKMKSDHSIRLAIKSLSHILPDIFKKIEHSQAYIGTDLSGNKIEMSFSSGYLKTKSKHISPNNSIHEHKNALHHIKNYLIQDGHSTKEIKEKLNEINALQRDNPLWVNPQTYVIKRTLKSVDIDFKKSSFITDRAVILIAYEFLSLICGEIVFYESFGPVRDFILSGDKKPSNILVERLRSSSDKYESAHTIFTEFADSYSIINIIFFGWLWFKVKFDKIVIRDSDFVYIDDLLNKTRLLASSLEDAKQNNFFKLVSRFPP